MNMVVAPTRSRISKGECSVALALVAMAQKNMDLTIENLIAHREGEKKSLWSAQNLSIGVLEWKIDLFFSPLLFILGAKQTFPSHTCQDWRALTLGVLRQQARCTRPRPSRNITRSM